jgi:tetratricopeptide (TPR) repeat protein
VALIEALPRSLRQSLDPSCAGRAAHISVCHVRPAAQQNIGTIAAMQGDHARAELHFSRSYGAFRDAGYERGMALALNNYGRSALECGNHALAEHVLAHAEQLALRLTDIDPASMCMLNGGEAMLARGAVDEAEDLACRAVGHFGMAGNQWRRLECLCLLGDIERVRHDEAAATLYYEAALAVAREVCAGAEIRKLEARLAQDRAGGVGDNVVTTRRGLSPPRPPPPGTGSCT